MPDLVGVGEEEARRRLLALGVGLDHHPAFSVVSSTPPVGARISGAATVVLGVRGG